MEVHWINRGRRRLVLTSGEGISAMSQLTNRVLAILALSATLGAVPFASGHDLINGQGPSAPAPQSGVNRAGKTDRDAVKAQPNLTRTIALQLNGLADTSVVLRVPLVSREETGYRPAAPAPKATAKSTVACEPPVSVLTDIAKLLQPARCVT
jgi:hypothetical protein